MQRVLLPGTWSKSRFAFGASLLKGSHPKTKRVFNAKLPLHVVLKSSKAKGAQSFLLHSRKIAIILSNQAARHHVRLQQVANASNHIHLLLEAPSREHLSGFLRTITGHIALCVARKRKKSAIQVSGAHQATTQPFVELPSRETASFWDARPFSRIVSRGRDHRHVARYLGMNSTEMARLSRANVRGIFSQIEDALKRGLIPRTSGLVAAGFG